MKRYSIFIVEHRDDLSHEVAFAQAMEIDAAIEKAGCEPVGGSYAKDGDAVDLALKHVFGGE